MIETAKGEDFWQILTEALDDNIANIDALLDDEENEKLPAEEYKLHMQNLRYRKKYLEHLKELPDLLISHLQTTPEQPFDTDPYPKP